MNRRDRIRTPESRRYKGTPYVHLGLVPIVLLLASVLMACDPGPVNEVGAEAEAAKKPTHSPVESPRLVVGDTAILEESSQTELTVYSYESPLTPTESEEPEPGFEFSAAEVEGCASSTSFRDPMIITPNAFSLRLADGGTVLPEESVEEAPGGRKPVLRSMDPSPGECERGYVIYETPKGESAELVVFEDSLTETQAIAWKVQDAQRGEKTSGS